MQQTAGSQQGPPTLAFPYLRDGELVNAKYRTFDKRFWQHKDAEKVCWPSENTVARV